jgi:SNF2 family DNA or RNA helicase
MGLGKTLSVLATLDLLLTKGSLDFCLIVCPNSLARNWQREARRFIPKRSCLLLPEAPKERGVLLKSLLRGQLKAQALMCLAPYGSC